MSALHTDDVHALGLSLAGVSLDSPATSTTQGTDAAIGHSAPAAQRVALTMVEPQTVKQFQQPALFLSMRHDPTQAEGSASRSAQETRTEYPCPKCGCSFFRSHNRNIHHRSVHEPLLRHTCTVEGCQRSYVRRHTLMRHIQVTHQTQRGQRTRQQRDALPAAGQTMGTAAPAEPMRARS